MDDLATPHGPARVHVRTTAAPARGWLILGHGAGGGITARDLTAAGDAALELDVHVALVEQPYRVAGRRSPAPAHHLDAAWVAVVEHLRSGVIGDSPAVTGGRSSGARVACRTARETAAVGVLCLAFPLVPPRRASGKPPTSRLDELDAVHVPALVVQGARDPFGIPPPSRLRSVVTVSGDHSLRSDLESLGAAVRAWLTDLRALKP